MINADVSPAPPIIVRNWTTVSATATVPNSLGLSRRARMGTVTNFSPNVAVFESTLQPTFAVTVFTPWIGDIKEVLFLEVDLRPATPAAAKTRRRGNGSNPLKKQGQKNGDVHSCYSILPEGARHPSSCASICVRT